MFEYRIAGDEWVQDGSPAGEVWSLTTLQPLSPGALTPFSYSVVAELTARGWYEHYQSLGLQPPTRPKVVRSHLGRAYFNLSLSARLEAQQGGVEPPALRINNEYVSLSAWEKPGFLGGLRTNRAQKCLTNRVAALDSEYGEILSQAQAWHAKTTELKWTQADILQVMEEIERVGAQSYAAFLAARRQIEYAYNRLLLLTSDRVAFPQSVNLINHAVCDIDGLVERDMVGRLLQLATVFGQAAAARQWLEAGVYDQWSTAITGQPAVEMNEFLAEYGHRTAGEGELANARWSEDPTPIFMALRAYIAQGTRPSTPLPAKAHAQKLAAAGMQAKEIPSLIAAIRQASLLQSKALNAIAYVLAGTRRWALAAGREATTDQRLNAAEDVFFYELEEIKQMMTGEWNISAMDAIRVTAAERREEYTAYAAMQPATLLIGDGEAVSAMSGLPATEGKASGPLRRHHRPRPPACEGAIIGTEQLDSGWSILLPIANGLISACGTPMDPVIAAGRLWHTPIMVDVGARYAELVDGAHTTLDIETIVLDQ